MYIYLYPYVGIDTYISNKTLGCRMSLPHGMCIARLY